MQEILAKYLPGPSVEIVCDLLDKNPCKLKIVNNRKTKHGDFRKLPSGRYQITINNDLNKYRFLLTLIHEVAHLVTFKGHGRVKPHGLAWKRTFQQLMLPYLHPEIYPHDILPVLANYLKNPKASSDSDVKLSWVLNQYDEHNGKNYIFELGQNTRFLHNKRIFEIVEKRRTRYLCREIKTKKNYLFHQNAAVTKIEDL